MIKKASSGVKRFYHGRPPIRTHGRRNTGGITTVGASNFSISPRSCMSFLPHWLVLFLSAPWASSYCRDVPQGHHYFEGHAVVPEFVNATARRVTVTFGDDAAAYACNCSAEPFPSCMYSWNKLWGSSRCGFAHAHHQDSDRFVWRRQMADDGATPGDAIELAAYSYDGGVNPNSPPNPNLLQPFSTTLQPGIAYALLLDVSDPASSIFEVSAPAPASVQESKTVEHANACARAAEGYRLSLYFGGQCRAPSTVSVCYTEEDPAAKRGNASATMPRDRQVLR